MYLDPDPYLVDDDDNETPYGLAGYDDADWEGDEPEEPEDLLYEGED